MATISGKLTTTYALSATDLNLTILQSALVQTSSDGVDGSSSATWNVTNDGTVTSSNGYGVYLAGLNSILSNYGAITGLCAVALYDGGTVNNQAGATITSTGSPASSIDAVSGIHIANGTGTITNAGTITALGYGVGLDNGGTVTNASTGSITGGEDGVFFWGSLGYFYNYGQVKATVDDGVGFFAGGTMVNEVGGSVNATSGSGAAAVYFQSVAGTLQNDGSMIGTVAGAYFTGGGSVVNGANNGAALLQGNSYGVYISGGAGTVVNAGTISGGSYSVDFATTSTSNLLVVDPGAVFKGVAAGGTGTLQLARGAGAITGIGGNGTFRNFQTLAVNLGGTWTLSGAGNTIANLTDNGALLVTGSLKVSTAVNSSSSGLIQIGSATASGTLEVASEAGSLSQTSFVDNSKLIVDNAASFGTNIGTSSYVGPLLENFQTGDVIDFLNFASSGATISYNSAIGLAQISNGKQTATLDFQTSTLGPGALQIASDGGTGLDVTMSAAAGPTVTTVDAIALNGTSGASNDLTVGSTVTVTLTMSAAVNVNTSAPPALALDDGGTASYQSGSGTTSLTFKYAVAAGQNIAALAVSGIQNGGSITAASGGVVANLAGADVTLSSLSSPVQVDTTAPTVSAVAAPTGDDGPGAVVALTVNFSEAVTVNMTSGTPTLALSNGATATYISGSGSNSLMFDYIVGARGSGQDAADLATAATNALTLNGATISDAAGNAAVLTGADNVNPAGTLQIDTTAPTVSTITAPTGDDGPGAVVALTVNFSEAVTVNMTSGAPTLALSNGATATYFSGSGSNSLVFDYTVGALGSGQDTADLATAPTNALALNGATIGDAAGNAAVLTGANNISPPGTLQIDTTTPSVSPVLLGAGNTASYTQGGAPAVLDGALTVSDTGSTTLTGATVVITTGFQTGDQLNFTTQGGITGGYNASNGVLTLSGSATLAAYQTALDSIMYSSTNIDPTNGGADPTRTVAWSVNAGATNSSPVTSTIGVTAVAPVLSGAGNTASYTQGGVAAAVDGTLAVSDAGSPTLTGAAAAITTGFQTGDQLNFTTQGGIIGSYNASTGVLTLSGSATLAAYQTALDSVTYSSTNINPTNGGADPTRTVAWTASAGATNSAPVVSTIGVMAQTSVIGASVTTSFSGISDPTNWPPENGLAVGPANVVMVESSKIEWTNLAGATAVNESLYTLFASLGASQRNSLLDARVAYDGVNKRFVVMAENLGTNESNIDIAVSKDSNPNDGWYVGSVSSLLTLNGATTYADMPYLSVDGTNIYVSEGQYGSGLQGTQEWVFGDTAGVGGGIYNGGALATVASQVAPPSAGIARNVSNGQGLTYYVSVVPTGGQSVLTIQTYNSATNAFSAATTLALGNSDKGASSSDYTIAQKGTSLPLDAYDSRIASLAYSNGFLYGLSEVEPTGSSLPEIHWFKLNVSNPGAPTMAAQGDITGAAIGAAVGVFNGSLAIDAAGDMIANFTASSTNMYPADYYMVMPSGASSFGSPTLYQSSTSYFAQSASASGAQRWGTYSTAIADPNDPNGFWISNEYVTNSGIAIPSGLSAWWDTITAQVHVGPVTPPPVLAGAGNTDSYVRGGAAVAVDSGLSVTDAASTTLTGATIAVTGGFLAGDFLNFANQNGVTGSYNANSGILTLSGTASLATYQAALDSITFSTTNANPTTSGADSVRTVTWSVASGAQTSVAVTSTIDVGQTYTLTTNRDTIAAGAGNDTIIAPSSSTLNSGDSLNGGGGSNTLILQGGGTFNLSTPRLVSNIQTIDVLGSTTTSTSLTLRSGLNNLAVSLGASGQTETFNVAATGSTSDVFEMLSNNENVTIGGFSATSSTHDVLQFNAAAFGASLTAANQSADLAALLGDTKNNSSGSAVITDISGYSVTLTGISTSTLSTVANTGDFKFV